MLVVMACMNINFAVVCFAYVFAGVHAQPTRRVVGNELGVQVGVNLHTIIGQLNVADWIQAKPQQSHG